MPLQNVLRTNATIYELTDLGVNRWSANVQSYVGCDMSPESVASDLTLLPNLYRDMKQHLREHASEFGISEEDFEEWFNEKFPNAMRLNYL